MTTTTMILKRARARLRDDVALSAFLVFPAWNKLKEFYQTLNYSFFPALSGSKM
jgi:hypothetical protein